MIDPHYFEEPIGANILVIANNSLTYLRPRGDDRERQVYPQGFSD